MAKYRFWRNVISSNSPESAKRLVTLLMTGHFILTAFLISFFVFYLVLYTPKGVVNKDLIDLLDKVLDNEIVVILGGLAIIGAENLATAFIEKAKSKAAANIKVGAPTADDINIHTVNVEQKLKETKE